MCGPYLFSVSCPKYIYYSYIGIGFFSSISFVNLNLKFKCQIILQARTMSYQQKVIENGNNEEELRKTSLTSRPNIKELTHKQRNWFSSFEKNRTEVTSVDSVRRTSVKNDHTPNLLSGHGSCSPSSQSPVSLKLWFAFFSHFHFSRKTKNLRRFFAKNEKNPSQKIVKIAFFS